MPYADGNSPGRLASRSEPAGAAIKLTGNPALGLTIGEHSQLTHLGLTGVTAAQAPTVRAAARCISHFEPLYVQNYRGASQFIEDSAGA